MKRLTTDNSFFISLKQTNMCVTASTIYYFFPYWKLTASLMSFPWNGRDKCKPNIAGFFALCWFFLCWIKLFLIERIYLEMKEAVLETIFEQCLENNVMCEAILSALVYQKNCPMRWDIGGYLLVIWSAQGR